MEYTDNLDFSLFYPDWELLTFINFEKQNYSFVHTLAISVHCSGETSFPSGVGMESLEKVVNEKWCKLVLVYSSSARKFNKLQMIFSMLKCCVKPFC